MEVTYPTIHSGNFHMPVSQYARVATIFYLQRYWKLYALAMAMGMTIIVLQRGNAGLIFGMVLLLYPLTVPFRYSMVIGARASRFLQGEISYEIGHDELIVRTASGSSTKGEIGKAKSITEVAEHLVFLYGRSTFVILPLAPLSEDIQNQLRARFKLKASR